MDRVFFLASEVTLSSPLERNLYCICSISGLSPKVKPYVKSSRRRGVEQNYDIINVRTTIRVMENHMKTEVSCRNCSEDFMKRNSEIKKTKNHFCSQKCAATYNNKRHIKRPKKTKLCKHCSSDITALASYRVTCGCKKLPRYATLADVFSKRNRNAANAYIREQSRRAYKKSGRPMVCKVCMYNKHVDVCHVKGVADFPQSTKITTVNNLDNLVALCKNHHWELDRDLLSKVDRGRVELPWTN